MKWDRASRAEARDFRFWIQLTAKQRLQTSRPQAARQSSRTAGAPNPVTGKPASGDGYAPSTVAHIKTVLRRFYDSTIFTATAGPARCRTRPAGCLPPSPWPPERASQPDGRM